MGKCWGGKWKNRGSLSHETFHAIIRWFVCLRVCVCLDLLMYLFEAVWMPFCADGKVAEPLLLTRLQDSTHNVHPDGRLSPAVAAETAGRF